jgi:hypothetical protein
LDDEATTNRFVTAIRPKARMTMATRASTRVNPASASPPAVPGKPDLR